MKHRLTTLILLLIPVMLPASVQASDDVPRAGIIIVGPGDPMYTYWGHIGIAVDNPVTGENLFYDFGNFSFHSDHFYTDFAVGRMLYLGMVTPTDAFIRYSLTEDRDLMYYPLNLGADEIRILENRLRWWVLPENREYLYDYFRNNCSTIIRDVLDEAVGGALKDSTEGRIDRTFRHYARTGSDPSLAAELMLHFLLGPLEDEPIDEWDLMFLPRAVADIAMRTEYVGSDGNRRVLAEDPIVLKKSGRDAVPDEPRLLWPVTLAAGLATAAGWIALRRWRPRKKGLRRLTDAVRILFIMAVGLPGAALIFLWAGTNHVSAWANINLGPTLPTLLIGLIPLIRSFSRGERRREEVRLSWFWTVNLAGLAVVIILRLTGLSIQHAGAFWALYAPLLLAASRPGLWAEERILAPLR